MTAALESVIGYSFEDKSLLEEALTHSSFSREGGSRKDNERLEFLGDAFLDAIVGEEVFRRLPDASEGEMTKARALVVRGSTLAETAADIGLGSYLVMSRGQEKQGGRQMGSILEDAFEALIGAVYLDGGYVKAKEVVLRLMSEHIDDAVTGDHSDDSKSLLQELLQSKGRGVPGYRVTGETGPGHDKTFFVEVVSEGEAIGKGSGKSKKQAEQNAAKEGIERIR